MNDVALLAPADRRETATRDARAAAALFAPALGLAPQGMDIRLDREGDRLLADAGAPGAARGSTVWLRDFDPLASASRLTLAHELVHVAQARLNPALRPSRRHAEAEADRIASALVIGSHAAHPCEALASSIHFDGETPPAPPSLEELIRRNYRSETIALAQLLARPEPSSGDVARALAILAPLEFETARLLIAQLAGPDQLALANGLNGDHARANRREALAAASNFNDAALALRQNGLRLFRDMLLVTTTLSAAEHRAAVAILRLLPQTDLAVLDSSDNGPAFRALRNGTLPEYDQTAAMNRAARVEATRRGTGADFSEDEESLYNRLSILLTPLDRTRAQTACEALAASPTLDTVDPRFNGARRLTVDAPLAAVPASTIQNVIARLEGDNLVAPWIAALAPEDRAGDSRSARGFASLIRARRTDLTMERMRELLNTNFWDWAVRDWEARLAWDMLRNLPPIEQARFQSIDDGRLYLRLIEELPEDIRDSADFAGLVLVRGTDGSLADMTGAASTLLAGQSELIAAFREHVHDQSYELFVRLVRLGTPGPDTSSAAPTPDAPTSLSLLEAVVHRLDTLGLISTLFEALSAGVKQDRRYWNDIALVLGARDPAFNRADLRRLLHICGFLIFTFDSVSFEEALFAFHILRVLPADQRRMFEQEDGGSYAGRIAGALSQSMMMEAGLSFAFTRPDERGETPLRRQLADPAMWSGTAQRDLALLIQMAITAGDFDWVFTQSERQRAWMVEELGPVVDRFRLFDPRVGRLIPRPQTVSAATTGFSLLGILFGTGAYEMESFTRPVEGVDPFTGEATTDAEVSGMRITADLEQIERNAGGPLSTATVFQRSPGERVSIDESNRDAALQQANVVDIMLDETRGIMRVRASQLNLSQFANVSTGGTLRTGAVSVSGLDFTIHFAPGNLREPRGGHFHITRFIADEIIATSAGDPDVTGAQRLDVSQVDADATFQTSPLPDSPMLGHVLGLLWDLKFNRDSMIGGAMAHGALISATLSIGRMELQGLRMGDVRLASATMTGISVAAAGNRAANVRAQLFVLASRIERARRENPDGVADLLTEQARLEEQRRTLEPLETEMLALMAVLQSGRELPPEGAARLDVLQAATGIGAAGGLQVDIASMAISGLDGPVRIGEASLTNIHGGGESAALAFQQLTSGEAIRRFVESGAPTRARFGTGMANPGMTFTADELRLVNIVIPATIPTLAEIDQRLTQDNPRLTPAERERLTTLRPLVERYHQLRALSLVTSGPAEQQRTAAQQAELLAVSRDLGRRLDGRVADILLSGPQLTVRDDQDGLHFENVSIPQLTIDSLDYSNGTHHFWSTHRSTASGISAHIVIPRRQQDEAGTGEMQWRRIRIVEFKIDRIDGAGLGYERLEGGSRKFQLDIDSGALLGISLSNFVIDMTGAETLTRGGVDIGGFDQTRFRFAFRQMLEANGQLDRAVGSTPAVHIGMASDGRMTVDLDGLVATNTDVTYHGEGRSGGGMRIVRGDLSGGIVMERDMEGDHTRLKNLRMDRLELARVHWRTAGGTTIRADGATIARNVRFSGRYSTLSPDSSEFAIDSLRIGSLQATRIVADMGSVHIELPEPMPNGSYQTGEAATIHDIEVTGLLIGMDGAGTRIGPTLGTDRARVSTGAVSTNFLVDYAGQLQVRGMLDADRINFSVGRDGDMAGRATGLSGAGTVNYSDVPRGAMGPAALTAQTGFGFSNLDTGLIRYANNIVTIGANGSAPLRLDRLELNQFELTHPSVVVSAPDTSTITATDILARMSVHLHPDAAAAAAARSPFRKITIDEFRIGGVSAAGLRVHLPSMDLWIDLPENPVFTVGPITMVGPTNSADGTPFEITPSAAGTAISGRVLARELHTDRLQAHLVGALNARMGFHAAELNVGFASNGDMRVDLMNWSATQISGYVGGDPLQRINLRRGDGTRTRHSVDEPGIGADRLTYDSRDGGTITTAGLHVRGMRYDDPDRGIHLDIREIDVPEMAVDLGGNAAGRRVINIPSATINDAYFNLDKLAGTSGPATSSFFAGGTAAAWLAANHALFQSMQGNFAMAGRYGMDGYAQMIPGTDYSYSFDLPIENGRINYRELERQMPNLVDGAVDFRMEGSTLKLGAGFMLHLPGDPESMEPPPDPIPVYTYFAEWNLDSAHMQQVQTGWIDFDQLLRAEDPTFGTPPTSGGVNKLAPLIVDRLNLSLAMDNPSDVTVNLPPFGTATLAPHAMSGLSIHGDLQRLRPIDEAYPSLRHRSITNPHRPGELAVDLDHFNLSALSLNFPGAAGGSSVGVTTSGLHFGRVTDARIAFAGVAPQSASGTLTEAKVTNLVVTLDPVVGPPAPTTPAPRPSTAPPLDRPGEHRLLDNYGRLGTPP